MLFGFRLVVGTSLLISHQMEHSHVLANGFNQSRLEKECKYVIYDMLNLAGEWFSSIICAQTDFSSKPSKHNSDRRFFKPWEEVLLLKISYSSTCDRVEKQLSLSLSVRTFSVSIYIETGQNK